MTGRDTGRRMREAWEALPLTREERAARKQRYKGTRYLSKPLYGYEFAARLGVNEGTVKRWEKSGVVGDEYASAVSKALGIPVEEITRERRRDEEMALRDRLEELAGAAVTAADLDRAAEPLTAALDRHAAAIRFLANGKRREALRVLSGGGAQ